MTALADAAAPDDAEVTYTLPSLVAREGSATLDEVEAFVEGVSDTDLVDDGKGVATSRVSTDCARLYGKASDFWRQATAAQRAHLPGFSSDRIRVSIWCAAQGDAANAAFTAGASSSAVEQSANAQTATTLREQALTLREQLHGALRTLAGHNADLLHRADTAYGAAAAPGEALEAMVTLARSWTAKPTPAMKIRMNGTAITADWLDAAEKLGSKVTTSLQAGAAPRRLPAVSHADVDRWDGRNLRLLEDTMAMFEAGHAADPSIPRLVPNALRTYFGRRRTPKPDPTPTT